MARGALRAGFGSSSQRWAILSSVATQLCVLLCPRGYGRTTRHLLTDRYLLSPPQLPEREDEEQSGRDREQNGAKHGPRRIEGRVRQLFAENRQGY
jgi:hypothetical protein